MGQDSKIQWTHHTFNPWRGCTKVSAGCTNCYAETLSARNPKVLGVWGPKGTRVIASESMWRQPVKWNREAEQAGERRRVFCASLADVFENRIDLTAPRQRLFKLIESTPHLDWLLLTKRPDYMQECLAQTCLFGEGWLTHPRPNVWLGVSVENQAAADERIPLLLQTPAAVRFLSIEPLLGSVDLSWWLYEMRHGGCAEIHWAIVGGESGPGERPCDVAWIRGIVEQCKAAGVSCFVKQLGSQPHDCSDGSDRPNAGTLLEISDKKGGDIAEFPSDLRVREFPEVSA